MVQRCHADPGCAPAVRGDCQYEPGEQRRQCMVEHSVLFSGSGTAVYSGDVGDGGLFSGIVSLDLGGLVHGSERASKPTTQPRSPRANTEALSI